MSTQRRRPVVPRNLRGTPDFPPGIRKAVLQLLGEDALTTRTLAADWGNGPVFVVSDFSDPSYEWVLKSARRTKPVVLLIPADTWTVGGQMALRVATSVVFVEGKKIADRPTMLVGFAVDLRSFDWLGTVLSP